MDIHHLSNFELTRLLNKIPETGDYIDEVTGKQKCRQIPKEAVRLAKEQGTDVFDILIKWDELRAAIEKERKRRQANTAQDGKWFVGGIPADYPYLLHPDAVLPLPVLPGAEKRKVTYMDQYLKSSGRIYTLELREERLKKQKS